MIRLQVVPLTISNRAAAVSSPPSSNFITTTTSVGCCCCTCCRIAAAAAAAAAESSLVQCADRDTQGKAQWDSGGKEEKWQTSLRASARNSEWSGKGQGRSGGGENWPVCVYCRPSKSEGERGREGNERDGERQSGEGKCAETREKGRSEIGRRKPPQGFDE